MAPRPTTSTGTASMPTLTGGLASLVHYIVHSVHVIFYFIYFLLKSRPELEGSTKPLCLDNKPACCLHNVQHCQHHDHNKFDVNGHRPAPETQTWKSAPGKPSPTVPSWRQAAAADKSGGLIQKSTIVNNVAKVKALVFSLYTKVNPQQLFSFIHRLYSKLPKISLPQRAKAEVQKEADKWKPEIPEHSTANKWKVTTTPVSSSSELHVHTSPLDVSSLRYPAAFGGGGGDNHGHNTSYSSIPMAPPLMQSSPKPQAALKPFFNDAERPAFSSVQPSIRREVHIDSRPSPQHSPQPRPQVKVRILSQEVRDRSQPPSSFYESFTSASDATDYNNQSSGMFSPKTYADISGVSQVTRQWPPPSNATGAEVIKDTFLPPPESHTMTGLAGREQQQKNAHQYTDSVADQVRMCHTIAQSLSDSANQRSRGQRIYARSKDRIDRLSCEPDDIAEQSSAHSRDQSMTRVRNPQGDLRDYQRSSEEYQDLGGVVTNMMSPEKSQEISRMLLETEHSSGMGRGFKMFSRRRERSDRWVVEGPNPQQVVETVLEKAAALREHQRSSRPHASVAPMSTSYHDLAYNPGEHRSRLFSPPNEPSTRLFSPPPVKAYSREGSYDPFNATPRDWKTYSKQYGHIYR